MNTDDELEKALANSIGINSNGPFIRPECIAKEGQVQAIQMNTTEKELEQLRKAVAKEFALTEPVLIGASPDSPKLTPEQVAEAIALGFRAARAFRESTKP